MTQAFRFLHAASFRLQQPLLGTTTAPAPIGELAIGAPYLAAMRVFDLAVAEQVRFLLLSGDLLDPRQAGPRAIVFLEKQFARLAECGVMVYWSQGFFDRSSAWSSAQRWPANVHIFATDRIEQVVHRQAGQAIAEIFGWSHNASSLAPPPTMPVVEPSDIFRLLTGYLPETVVDATVPPVHLCCWGGRDRRETRRVGSVLLHWCGSTQGSGPDDVGSRGCTLVHVSESGEPKLTFHATETVRWHREVVQCDDVDSLTSLEAEMVRRTDELAAEDPPVTRVVTFQLVGQGTLARQLARDSVQAELLAAVRAKVRTDRDAIWIRALETSIVDVVPDHWYTEQTLLGDFVRSLRDLSRGQLEDQLHAALPSGLRSSLDQSSFSRSQQRHHELLRNIATLPIDDSSLERLRSQVAGLGGDLLGASWPGTVGETS